MRLSVTEHRKHAEGRDVLRGERTHPNGQSVVQYIICVRWMHFRLLDHKIDFQNAHASHEDNSEIVDADVLGWICTSSPEKESTAICAREFVWSELKFLFGGFYAYVCWTYTNCMKMCAACARHKMHLFNWKKAMNIVVFVISRDVYALLILMHHLQFWYVIFIDLLNHHAGWRFFFYHSLLKFVWKYPKKGWTVLDANILERYLKTYIHRSLYWQKKIENDAKI